MSKSQKRITCEICSMRRVKARTISRRKTTKRLCQPCYDADQASIFFSSPAGKWFVTRAIKHCTNSIPQDTQGLIELVNLYKQANSAKGHQRVDGVRSQLHDYELCHKSPTKGNGYTGMLVAENLYIGIVSINRIMSNTSTLTDFGYKVIDKGAELTTSNARTIISSMYDLTRVVIECSLKVKPRAKSEDFSPFAPMTPSEIFITELQRNGLDTNGYTLPDEQIDNAFEMLSKMPRLLCHAFLMQHGTPPASDAF
jgi:hypothetical protein